jgi:hypothetical protein
MLLVDSDVVENLRMKISFALRKRSKAQPCRQQFAMTAIFVKDGRQLRDVLQSARTLLFHSSSLPPA